MNSYCCLPLHYDVPRRWLLTRVCTLAHTDAECHFHWQCHYWCQTSRGCGNTAWKMNLHICSPPRANHLEMSEEVVPPFICWVMPDIMVGYGALSWLAWYDLRVLRGQVVKAHFITGISRWSNHLAARLFNWNFHPLEVVSRWRDPQLQVSENY